MSRIAVTAFSGWNDAGEAASGTIEHLLTAWPSHAVGAVDAEEYVDFQVNRPSISTEPDGRRILTWPDTELRLLRAPSGDELVTVLGPEPSLRWKRYCDEVLEQLQELGVDRVISLGALLADVPHSRDLPVSMIAESHPDDLVRDVDLYEGPVGVPTVLACRLASAGVDTTSIWVQVPHYISQHPSPKAVLALVRALQIEVPWQLPIGSLVEDAAEWERNVNELASTDEDVADYVERLEQAQDATRMPEASGDAIAAAFERFLRDRRSE